MAKDSEKQDLFLIYQYFPIVHQCVCANPRLWNLEIVDVDECDDDTHNCHSEATCTNTVGSFTCSCNEGYTGDGILCEGNEISKYLSTMQVSVNLTKCHPNLNYYLCLIIKKNKIDLYFGEKSWLHV